MAGKAAASHTKENGIMEQLRAKFPPEKEKVRDGKRNRDGSLQQYKFVPAPEIINRLNEVFGVRWSMYEVETVYTNSHVMKRVCIEVPDPDNAGQTWKKEGWGAHSLQGDPGDAQKSAFSKAVTKAASGFGVGLYLWGVDDDEDEHDPHVPNMTVVNPGMSNSVPPGANVYPPPGMPAGPMPGAPPPGYNPPVGAYNPPPPAPYGPAGGNPFGPPPPAGGNPFGQGPGGPPAGQAAPPPPAPPVPNFNNPGAPASSAPPRPTQGPLPPYPVHNTGGQSGITSGPGTPATAAVSMGSLGSPQDVNGPIADFQVSAIRSMAVAKGMVNPQSNQVDPLLLVMRALGPEANHIQALEQLTMGQGMKVMEFAQQLPSTAPYGG